MALTLDNQPDAIVSVSEDVVYEYTVTPDNVYFVCYNTTPFGLAKFTLEDLGAIAPPPVYVGMILHVTDTASIYYGSHVVTEIISSGGVSISFVVNTVFIGTETPAAAANAAMFDDFNYSIVQAILGPAYIAVIAQPKFTIVANNKVYLKVSEYVRSFLSGANIHSVAIGVTKTVMDPVDTITVVNTLYTSSQIKTLFRTGGSGTVAPKILDLSENLIFFKDFRTFITESNFTTGPDELFNTVDSNFTQTSTPTTHILGSQNVEIVDTEFKDPLNIVYLNFAGGYRNYVVANDVTISREFENETRFKSNSLSESIQSVQSFEAYEVNCENIRVQHSESIDQMIASPLAWLSDLDGNLTPIVIDKKSFQKYKSYDESLNFSFTFRLSETKQSQVN